MKVIIQIGYIKTFGRRREGQSVRAWVNDIECSWNDGNGKYLTSRAEATKGFLWYLWSGELADQDTIRFSAKTMLLGVGPDESRTFEALYYVDSSASVQTIKVSGVGQRGYPLLKGRVVELGSVSEKDKRESEIEEFLRDGF